MKKIISYIAIFLISALSTSAAEPILLEGKTWKLMNIHTSVCTNEIDTTYYSITVCGDTVIDSKTYKKMISLYDNGIEFHFAAYEENGRLFRHDVRYEIYPAKGEKIIEDTIQHNDVLLDFSLHNGDAALGVNYCTERIYHDDTYDDDDYKGKVYGYVLREDSIEVNNNKYRRLILGTQNGIIDYWVEGIGSKEGEFYTYFDIEVPTCETFKTQLVSVLYNGECIFTHHDFTREGTSTRIENTHATLSRPMENKVYDLSGKPSKKSSHGIYILNNRKFVH